MNGQLVWTPRGAQSGLFCALVVGFSLWVCPQGSSAEEAGKFFVNLPSKEGALFVMTNSTNLDRGNEIVRYNRFSDGSLQYVGSWATGGLGGGPAPTSQVFGVPIPATADGLGSQDGLILVEKDGQRRLFAVNAGDNTITCFQVTENGLNDRHVVASGGVYPASLAYRDTDDLLYVVNAGNLGSIQGFHALDCHMQPLPGSHFSLAGLTADPPFPIPAPNEVLTTPADLGFTQDGNQLVLAIKGGPASIPADGGLPEGAVLVFAVAEDGTIEGAPTVTPGSNADGTAGPFSFRFAHNGTMILNQANSGTVGSYHVLPSGELERVDNVPISALGDAVDDDNPLRFLGFNCWIAVHNDIAYPMTFGAIPATSGGRADGPGVISALRVGHDGSLSLLPFSALGSEGIVAVLPQDNPSDFPDDPLATLFGNHGIDLTIVVGSTQTFLYTVEPRVGQIGIWAVNADGTLAERGRVGGLAEGADPFEGTNPGINLFLERCFHQPEDDRSPECALGSAQGIVGF